MNVNDCVFAMPSSVKSSTIDPLKVKSPVLVSVTLPVPETPLIE